ncbi:hypothetical protein Acor_14450 [Acrocarpospora corrugata]|uniref:Uncharacterized protein n=1 Tax=Acrocarpospora corrugata TaxID=35763 RepID=A0A5M3VUM6_9ACTN|nr:hypothetical protein Acor_14450 [Acrocarpospora corrugata]
MTVGLARTAASTFCAMVVGSLLSYSLKEAPSSLAAASAPLTPSWRKLLPPTGFGVMRMIDFSGAVVAGVPVSVPPHAARASRAARPERAGVSLMGPGSVVLDGASGAYPRISYQNNL